MIRIEKLHKYFNKGRANQIHVINDISLELPEHGMVAIFGKSGCGKTTLLNVIGGLDNFASGLLSVDGEDIRKGTDLIRNRSIGYIFQNYNLNKEETCYDNVADALRLCGMRDGEEMDSRVHAALANVDMDKYVLRTPDTLSGGQQQRIAIARAIVKNPKIILADEPTGNLDEANTLLIMDLLKQISQDHLVLLVTHEAHLVDHYCDTVIELKDGRVEHIRQNENAHGMVAKDKNHIYLGELERTELTDGRIELSYYGASPASPIKLRVVNQNGKLYVKIDTAGVQVLDDTAEIKLREGTFDPAPEQARATEHPIDMTALPPIEGTKYGRLFRFGSSVKSGYAANFKKQKKGKRFLRACMCLFAAVVVLVTAVFGTAFGELIEIDESYSHNTYYVYTPDKTVSDALMSAASEGKYGINAAYLRPTTPRGDEKVKFVTGYFESFSTASYDESFQTNAVYLPRKQATGATLLAGKDMTEPHDLLITRTVADDLLELSSVGYISEYRDLIGLVAGYNGLSVSGESCRIVGVIEGSERAVYLSDAYFEEQALSYLTNVFSAEDYGVSAKDGQVVIAVNSSGQINGGMTDGSQVVIGKKEAVTVETYEGFAVVGTNEAIPEVPKEGEVILIHGKEFTVARVINRPGDYSFWVDQKYGISPDIDAYEFYRQQVTAAHPSWDAEQIEQETQRIFRENGGYAGYLSKIYAHIDEYMEQWRLFGSDSAMHWAYYEMGVEEAKYRITGADAYYRYAAFEKQYGRPYDEFREGDGELLSTVPELQEIIQPYFDRYETEISRREQSSESKTLSEDISFLLTESDRVSLASCYGENHPAIMGKQSEYEYVYYSDGVIVDTAYDTVYGGSGAYGQQPNMYTVLHTSDPEALDAWLKSEFSHIEAPGNRPALVTPETIRDQQMEQNGENILVGLITIAVLLTLLAVCMYFIMRSVLMGRIKEVGIYRAIGVTRKNLCFRFFIEALVLTTLTVFIGFLVSSGGLFYLLSGSTLMSSMMYYPVWLAGVVLVVLYALCTVCGLLPILSLTRKSPAAILAKYDI